MLDAGRHFSTLSILAAGLAWSRLSKPFLLTVKAANAAHRATFIILAMIKDTYLNKRPEYGLWLT